MGWLFYVAAAAGMLWQLPRVRELGQGRGTLVWVLLWLVVLTLGTLYFYGGSWLDQWRLV
jgi:hypothetical protein